MEETLRAIADQLTSQLELDRPPVQISYLDSAPPGVPEHPGGVPSVCTFFALGASKPFFAPLSAHEQCEVGAFVLGVPPQGELGTRLFSMVGQMHSVGYLNPAEENHIPRNPTPPKFVAYGPLGSLPMSPTGVLLFANPRGAMLAVEAAGSGTDGRPVTMNSRPMCAIMPILRKGTPVGVSLACTGSRIYTDMGIDKMVVGIRGDQLGRFAEKLDRIVRANGVIAAENTKRKRAAASTPSPS